MPPKVKITAEDIINAAVKIVQKVGEQGINARTLADELNCSTQPIFSNFATMEKLRLALVKKSDEMCREYMEKEVKSEKYPVYKAHGMAYIRFAKEQRELFKLLYMRDRFGEKEGDGSEITDEMENIIVKNTGISNSAAKMFHLEMWACVHGIATMFATGFVDLDWEIVSKMLTDTYMGLKKQYETEQ